MGLLSYIGNKLLGLALLFLMFVFFLAGGMALAQNNVGGWVLLFIALILLLASAYYMKRE